MYQYGKYSPYPVSIVRDVCTFGLRRSAETAEFGRRAMAPHMFGVDTPIANPRVIALMWPFYYTGS